MMVILHFGYCSWVPLQLPLLYYVSILFIQFVSLADLSKNFVKQSNFNSFHYQSPPLLIFQNCKCAISLLSKSTFSFQEIPRHYSPKRKSHAEFLFSGYPHALLRSELSLTQMPLDILILLLWSCSLPPQHHAIKTLLCHTKTQLDYYLQFFELKTSQKHNNDVLVPLEKQGN